MAVYLLNLTFDQAAAASASGLFVPTGSDGTSGVWYTVPQTPAAWPTTPVSQGGQIQQAAPVSSWGTPVSDSHSLQCNLNDSIYIRMAPRNGWSGRTPMQLRFTTVFGSTPGSNDGVATPFVLGDSSPCALYTTDTAPTTSNQQDYTAAGTGDGSWIFYLGVLSQNAVGQKANGGNQNPNRNCNYSFIASATVIDSNGEAYTYGHDPQMGVKG